MKMATKIELMAEKIRARRVAQEAVEAHRNTALEAMVDILGNAVASLWEQGLQPNHEERRELAETVVAEHPEGGLVTVPELLAAYTSAYTAAVMAQHTQRAG